MVAQSFYFYQHQNLHEIPTWSPPAEALNTGGIHKSHDFLPISRCISQTIQDSAFVTMEGDRNAYAIYQIVPFSMTLNKP